MAVKPTVKPAEKQIAKPARRIVDISIYLENDVISDPIGIQPKIEYINHRALVAGMTAFIPGRGH